MSGVTTSASHSLNAASIRRPARWDVPFGERMSDHEVEQLMRVAPFSEMDQAKFPAALSLKGILKNDVRIVDYQDADIVIREGEYGSSAFLVLEGHVRVCLESLKDKLPPVGASAERKSLATRVKQLWGASQVSEYRTTSSAVDANGVGLREQGRGQRLFIQDVPRLLDENKTIELGAGEVFGELAALTRTTRSATVVATGCARLVEIRWQGLRDLMRFDSALRTHMETLYRQNSLNVHLRETPFLASLPKEAMEIVAERTLFENYGDFDWHHDFRSNQNRDVARRVEHEPLIAEQGDYPDGLILIRSGFARITYKRGKGEETLAYLGKGHCFGLEELWHNWKHVSGHPLLHSLRAIGYVDILRIPTDIVEDQILPHIDTKTFEFCFDIQERSAKAQNRLEFMLDHRLINGTQAMVIDLDRCTRCDDCVRACAAAHDNNPRFVREGPVHDRLMFAGACMHCVDPVCMIGCPTGAIGRAPETGTISIQDQLCIGCGTCANSCPYDNIRVVEIRDKQGQVIRDQQDGQPVLKATKCDLCSGLPQGPACQNSCPHDALVRLDLGNLKQIEQWIER